MKVKRLLNSYFLWLSAGLIALIILFAAFYFEEFKMYLKMAE